MATLLTEAILSPFEFTMPSSKAYSLLGCLALLYVGSEQWLPLSSPFHQHHHSNELLNDFRFCRVSPASSIQMMESGLTVEYQCAGEEYHKFAGHLEGLALNESFAREHWGRRTSLAPHNQTVLMMGNSHTKQLFQAMACQYSDQLIDVRSVNVGSLRARFHNNVTLYIITNNALLGAQNWQSNLEQTVLKRPLSSMDAIVLGHFNTVEETTMRSYLRTFPTPPKVEDIAQIYDGPVIWTGEFAHRNIFYHHQTSETMQQLAASQPNRTNLRTLYAREYIEKLPSPQDECSTEQAKGVGTCAGTDDNQQHREGHRCMGPRGGHPDLIAWDLTETLHELLGFCSDSTTSEQ